MKNNLKKFEINNYHEIINELDLDDSEYTIIKNTKSDAEALSKLVNAKHYPIATKFLALGLPNREAIWWGYLCCQNFASNSSLLAAQNALSTISQWVHSPSEALRMRTKQLADNLNKYTAAHWACLSVYWSGGNIAATDQQVIEPAKYMSTHAVSNAIYLCARKAGSEDDAYSKYLKIGLHIAMGGNGKVT